MPFQPGHGLRRRAFVLATAAGLAAARVQAHEPGAARPRKARTAAVAEDDSEQRFQQLVAQGEAALAQGRAEHAVDRFELAAGIRHAAPAELGLVRAWMQQGQYRRALAFVAHAAGVHRDVPAGSALYAWLLHVGGQPAFAVRTMASALERHPADPLLLATAQRLHQPQAPAELLLQPPVRLAPYAVARPGSDAPPAPLQVVGSAVWVSPTEALLPLAALTGAERGLWLRDAAGVTSRATVGGQDAALGLARVSIDRPALPRPTEPAVPAWAPRDAFPGSPAWAFEHGTGAGWVNPEWPVMRSGFIGRLEEGRGYALGVELRFDGPAGGPVFDAQGRVIGLGLRREGAPQLVPATALRAWVGAVPATAPAVAARLAPDELYERGMALTAQVLRAVG